MGVEKTKEEWARRHLAQMGNLNPTPENIDIFVGLITKGSDNYDDFYERQYKRWFLRDEDEARKEYDRQHEEESKKTLNERYMEDEVNDGPFFNVGEN